MIVPIYVFTHYCLSQPASYVSHQELEFIMSHGRHRRAFLKWTASHSNKDLNKTLCSERSNTSSSSISSSLTAWAVVINHQLHIVIADFKACCELLRNSHNASRGGVFIDSYCWQRKRGLFWPLSRCQQWGLFWPLTADSGKDPDLTNLYSTRSTGAVTSSAVFLNVGYIEYHKYVNVAKITTTIYYYHNSS